MKNKNDKNLIQKDLIVEFFKKNPNRDIKHPEVVDWVVSAYKKKTGREGAELHVDHIIPKDWGGKATIKNGQTLCSRCNFLKKNLKQTESGKKMFIV